MKHKIFALILALTVASWAQTATQTAPSTPAPDKAKPACCDKMAAKDGASCQRHAMKDADGKEMASCCNDKDAAGCCGKDGKSCMKDGKASASCGKDCCSKDKTAAACCGDKCGKDGKSCCSGKDEKKTAMNCCAKHQHS